MLLQQLLSIVGLAYLISPKKNMARVLTICKCTSGSTSTSTAIDYRSPSISATADHHGCGGVKAENTFQISLPEVAGLNPDSLVSYVDADLRQIKHVQDGE